MATYETLMLATDARGVAYLTLNRPEKRNALSALMIEELTCAMTALGQSDVRAVVLAGAGSVFCAGGDLDWMKAQIAGDRATRIREARKLAVMLQAMNTLPKPLIGRVHGGAFGGGVGLACVCDLVVADPQTKFGLTETRLGLIPATISPYVVARIGEGRARPIFMSARIFDAAEARDLGLITTCAPDLDAATEAEIAPFLLVSPVAAAAAKALARSLGPRIDDAVIDETIQRLVETWETEDAAHGIAAFLAKTKPRWA